MSNIHKMLKEIEDSHCFDQLKTLMKPEIWNGWHVEERMLLARLLTLQGSHQLAEGNQQALESFQTAAEISHQDPQILLQQGMVLSTYRENIRCLSIASELFLKAVQINPSLLDAWICRAQVLVDIGIFENDGAYFHEAHQCYAKAFSLLSDTKLQISEADFFWKWGFCLGSLGKLSGEPLDFHEAIEKFHRAYECGCNNFQFYLDFGHSYADLAALLEKKEYFDEALNLFSQAVEKNPLSYETWFQQGCCMQCMLEHSYDEELCIQAEQSFTKASELDPDLSSIWLKWGQLETAIGKAKRDLSLLESSLKKFARAFQLDPGHSQILNSWAETVLFLGSQEERLDLIQAAKEKLVISIEIQRDDHHAWYLYGSCFNELGRYFHSEDYYHAAIEKFQYGLTLSSHYPLLWYGLALAHFALGELKDDQSHLEKAVRYCSKVIECGGAGFSQFWNDWGVALLKLAEMTEDPVHVQMAIDKFEKALKHPADDLDFQDVDLEWVYNYGSAYDLLGELTEESAHIEKAVQILTQVVRLDPDYFHARYNLALALANLGEAHFDVECYQKASEHFQVLIDQDSEDDMIHLDYGMSLINLALLIKDANHPEPAQVLFKHAESNLMQAASLGNTQSYYQLAGLYSITDHLGQAMYYLERARFFEALPGIDDLLHDEWLESLRLTPPFRQFINELSSRQSTDDKI